MKAILLIELVCVYMGVVIGFPWYNGAYRKSNPLRWRQSNLYRYQEKENSWIEKSCKKYESRINGGGFNVFDRTGALCLKSQDLVKILSWCPYPYTLPENAEYLSVKPTVLDIRESNISPCRIFDVTIRGVTRYRTCFFMLIKGVLSCVEEEELQPEYQILTIFPTIEMLGGSTPQLNYIICSTNVGNLCLGKAEIISDVVYKEFTGLRCESGSGSGPC